MSPDPFFRLIASVFWGCVVVGLSLPVMADGFFAPAPDLRSGLDPDGIFPVGQRIAFGLYTVVGQNDFDPTQTNMQRVADAGFTLAGPYYHSNWNNFQFIDEAAANGLGYTYQIRQHGDLHGVSVDDRPDIIAGLTDSQITGHVRTQVEAILADPLARDTVVRWAVRPEELRYWKSGEMRYLQLVSDTVRAVEMEQGVVHRPLWMYEPNHRKASDLVASGGAQDLVSKGSYVTTRHDRGDQRSGWSLWSFDQITSAAETLGTTPQAVFQLSEDFTDPMTGADPDEIRRVIRHDVYLGLVEGIKSLNVWSMWEERPNLTTHNEQFEAYGSVATDLTGDLDLQRPFLFGQPRDDLTISVLDGLQTIHYTHTDGNTFSFPAVNYLNAAVDEDRYLILVNSSESTVDVSIDGLPTQYMIADLFGGSAEAGFASSRLITMAALDVVAFRISDRAPTDFDGDGDADCADIDSLVTEVAGETHDGLFDLTDDGIVTMDDVGQWLADAAQINLGEGSRYPLGDANLDGASDARDFRIWNDNVFTEVAGWCSGNFNADGSVDGADFNIWNDHRSSPAFNTVPEPCTQLWILSAWLLVPRLRSFRSSLISRRHSRHGNHF